MTLASSIGSAVSPPNAGGKRRSRRRTAAIWSSRSAPTATRDALPTTAANCLWGTKMSDIDFARVKPLFCGAQHRRLYGVTGFEDPKHWCNLALATRPTPAPPAHARSAATQAPPATQCARDAARPRAGRAERTAFDGVVAVGARRGSRLPLSGALGSGDRRPGQDRRGGLRRPQPRHAAFDSRGALPRLRAGHAVGSTDVTLGPGEAREVRVRAPNCGSASNPDIRPNVVRAGKFD